MTCFAAPRLAAPPRSFPELTEREHEIFALIAQHRTNPEIAAHLGLSPKTIRNHVSNIFVKLQVGDRAEAGWDTEVQEHEVVNPSSSRFRCGLPSGIQLRS
jgi:DNA-binding CsgD family transcriptional regulator